MTTKRIKKRGLASKRQLKRIAKLSALSELSEENYDEEMPEEYYGHSNNDVAVSFQTKVVIRGAAANRTILSESISGNHANNVVLQSVESCLMNSSLDSSFDLLEATYHTFEKDDVYSLEDQDIEEVLLEDWEDFDQVLQ